MCVPVSRKAPLNSVLLSIYFSVLALWKRYILSQWKNTGQLLIQVRFFCNIYSLIVYAVLMKFYSKVSKKNYIWDCLKKKSVVIHAKEQKLGCISLHRILQIFLQNPTLCTDFREFLHKGRSLKFPHDHAWMSSQITNICISTRRHSPEAEVLSSGLVRKGNHRKQKW